MLQLNVFYPFERKRFPICRLTWIVMLPILVVLLLITNNYSNEEIGDNTTLKSVTSSLIIMSIPLLGLVTYCRFRGFHKKPLDGKLLNEIAIDDDRILVGDKTFMSDNLSELEVTINSYRNSYSHGIDNQLIVRDSNETKSVYFELQSKPEYHKLLDLLSTLRENGLNVKLIDNLRRN